MSNQDEASNYLSDYNERFDPRKYLTEHVNDVISKDSGLLRKFVVDTLHRFFEKPEVHGDRLLEIGTGPAITSVISATNKFRHIYLSDISRPSLDALWQWQRGDTDAHDFSPFFKYIISLEKSSENWEDRQRRLRDQIQGILYGDMFKDRPFEPCYFPAFDGIVSSLSVLSTTKEDVIRRACLLLKTGGWMVATSVLQESFYTIQDQTFYTDYETVDDVVACWKKCGLEIVDVITSSEPGEPPEGRIHAAILARKL